jgi:hypothetical protein
MPSSSVVTSEKPMTALGRRASLGPPGERGEVDPVEDSQQSDAAPEAPDRVDGVVAQGGVEVVEPLVVAAGEPAVARRHVGAEPRLEAEGAAERFGADEIVVLEQPARGRHQRYPASGCERRRPPRRF